MSAHPDDLASVTAANRDRLMGVAAAISTITNSERDMIDLADLEAKALAATQGEWETWEIAGSRTDVRTVGANGRSLLIADGLDTTLAEDEANAAYIAAAQPSVVLELIERIRAAEAKAGEPVAATHRHKRNGKKYVSVGVGIWTDMDRSRAINDDLSISQVSPGVWTVMNHGVERNGRWARLESGRDVVLGDVLTVYCDEWDFSYLACLRDEFEAERFEAISSTATPPSHSAPVDTAALAERVKTL